MVIAVVVVVVPIIIPIVVVTIIVMAAQNRDFDRPVIAAGGMLNVDPGPALVERVEVQAGEFRSRRAVATPSARCPRPDPSVAVLVQILGEPDVVVDAAVPVLDDVDVAVVVDREVVGIRQRRAHRKAGGQVDGVPVGEDARSCCASDRAGRSRGWWSSSCRDSRRPCTVWICMSSGRW